MLSGPATCRNLLCLIWIGSVLLAPVLSARPHPNDVYLAISHDGLQMCLIDQPVVECLERSTAVDCAGAMACSLELPVLETVPADRTCASERCGDAESACPKTRSCCVRVRLGQQPLLVGASPVQEPAKPLPDVLASGDEKAEPLGHEPPVPPPRTG